MYACLVCGKYFQGRGQNTHAYTHSVSEEHRVYLNLETKKFYCLPDNYEVIDPSLADIVYVLNPTFTPEFIKKLETSAREVRAFHGGVYLPGIVGLNNIKANDYCNVILQVRHSQDSSSTTTFKLDHHPYSNHCCSDHAFTTYSR